MKTKTWILLFGLAPCVNYGQIVWSENFSGYAACTTIGANNNITNPAADWTTVFTDCDDGVTCTIGQSFFGTNGGEFVINDIEGGPCCAPGGTCDNTITTETIDISTYGGVAVSVSIRHDGGQEAGALGGCDNSEDIAFISYSLDGGPFTQFSTNGFLNGNWPTPTSGSQTCVSGNTLVIRIMAGNKANTETVYFDNIVVDATTCPPLPIELNHFNLLCNDNNQLEANWGTNVEVNNSHFILQGSANGIYYEDLVRVEGSGNSNAFIEYITNFSNEHNDKYFRLIQVDFNGMSKAFDPVYVDCTNGDSKFTGSYKEGYISLVLPAGISGELDLVVCDLQGKSILNQQLFSPIAGQIVTIPLASDLANGIYVVAIVDQLSGRSYHTKVFKN